MTLQEALALATRQSPDVAAARAQAAVAAAGVNRAWTAWQPDISVSGQFVHTNAPAEFDLGLLVGLVGGVFDLAPANPGLIPGPSPSRRRTRATRRRPSPSPSSPPRAPSSSARPRRAPRRRELGAEEAREQVLLAVARTYLGVQGISQMMDAAREAEQVALQRESEAKSQLSVGMTVEATLLRAQTETAQARVQLAQLSGQYVQLLAMLGALVGEPVQPAAPGLAQPQWVIPTDGPAPLGGHLRGALGRQGGAGRRGQGDL